MKECKTHICWSQGQLTAIISVLKAKSLSTLLLYKSSNLRNRVQSSSQNAWQSAVYWERANNQPHSRVCGSAQLWQSTLCMGESMYVCACVRLAGSGFDKRGAPTLLTILSTAVNVNINDKVVVQSLLVARACTHNYTQTHTHANILDKTSLVTTKMNDVCSVWWRCFVYLPDCERNIIGCPYQLALATHYCGKHVTMTENRLSDKKSHHITRIVMPTYVFYSRSYPPLNYCPR